MCFVPACSRWISACLKQLTRRQATVQGDNSSHASDMTVYMCCRDPEPGLKTAYGLCQQMIHFFHQLRLYITFEVIEPAWLHMNARMKAASTLDEVRALLL